MLGVVPNFVVLSHVIGVVVRDGNVVCELRGAKHLGFASGNGGGEYALCSIGEDA